MSDDLIFYHNPMSRGRMVRWMLEEVGHPYRTDVLDYASTLKGPEFLQVNPMGKVPAIQHRGVVVTETAAICAYLADAFPDAGLAPAHGSADRGPYYRWLFFMAGPFEAAVTNKSLDFQLPPGKERMAGYGSFEKVMDTLESAVKGGGYLAGGRFSAADLYVGAHIGFGLAFNSIEKRPAFVAYAEKLASRPAAIRAREIDDALISKQS